MPIVLIDVPEDIITIVDAEVQRRRAAHEALVFDESAARILVRPTRPRRAKMRDHPGNHLPDIKVVGIGGREKLYQDLHDKALKIHEAAYQKKMVAYFAELKAFKLATSARKHERPRRPSRVRVIQELLRVGLEHWPAKPAPKPKTKPKRNAAELVA